jgi:hypothetical protein
LQDEDLLVALDPTKTELRFQDARGGVAKGHRAILDIGR